MDYHINLPCRCGGHVWIIDYSNTVVPFVFSVLASALSRIDLGLCPFFTLCHSPRLCPALQKHSFTCRSPGRERVSGKKSCWGRGRVQEEGLLGERKGPEGRAAGGEGGSRKKGYWGRRRVQEEVVYIRVNMAAPSKTCPKGKQWVF